MPSGNAHMNCHASALRAASLRSACVASSLPYRMLSLIVPEKLYFLESYVKAGDFESWLPANTILFAHIRLGFFFPAALVAVLRSRLVI